MKQTLKCLRYWARTAQTADSKSRLNRLVQLIETGRIVALAQSHRQVREIEGPLVRVDGFVFQISRNGRLWATWNCSFNGDACSNSVVESHLGLPGWQFYAEGREGSGMDVWKRCLRNKFGNLQTVATGRFPIGEYPPE